MLRLRPGNEGTDHIYSALERVQIFILAEGLKIELFGIIRVEKAVWYKLFVNLVYN